MELSYLLARIIGIALIVIYTGVLLNRNTYATFWPALTNSPVTFFITGVISLILGLIIIQIHNIWVPDWRVIITIIGWLGFISGALRILLPELVLQFGNKFFEDKEYKLVTGIAGLLVAIGAYLTYIGYIH